MVRLKQINDVMNSIYDYSLSNRINCVSVIYTLGIVFFVLKWFYTSLVLKNRDFKKYESIMYNLKNMCMRFIFYFLMNVFLSLKSGRVVITTSLKIVHDSLLACLLYLGGFVSRQFAPRLVSQNKDRK